MLAIKRRFMVRFVTLASIPSIVLLTACGGDSLPSPPSPSPPLASAPSGVVPYLRGYVVDTVNRPVSGAFVEILDGGRAGASTTSDDIGEFRFADGPNGAVTVRASQDGFIPTTVPTAWSTNPNNAATTRVILKSVEPSLAIALGAYTMTVISDPSASGWAGAPCAGFPPEFRSRAYDATISRSSQSEAFQVSLASPTLLKLPAPFKFGFDFTQAANFVGFELELGFNGPIEELSDYRYVTVSGNAPTAEPARSTEQSLTIPFWGTFEYCQLTSPKGPFNACNQVPANQRVEYYACTSPKDLMVLTKQ